MAKRKYGRFGGYLSPVVVLGAMVPCEVRGIVKIVAMSTGPIAWPIGEKDGQRSLIIYKGLARALHAETAEQVASWWGIDLEAVRRWQAGERVPLNGPRAALAERPPPEDDWENRRKAWQLDDEAKTQARSSSPNGDPPAVAWPAPALAPLADGDAHADLFSRKRRWEPWEDNLVRTCTVEEVVRQTNRKPAAVWARRLRLGVSAPRASRV